MHRLGVLAVLVIGALTATLTLPQSAYACLCAGPFPGEVQFIGTATDGPDEGWFEMFDGGPGVYTFTVEEVLLGDPGDGRVFTTDWYSQCGRRFDIGARYKVHAEVVEPTEAFMSYVPGVPLVTTTCLHGSPLAPAPTGFLDSLGLAPWLGGLVVVSGGAIAFAYRRRVLRTRASNKAGD